MYGAAMAGAGNIVHEKFTARRRPCAIYFSALQSSNYSRFHSEIIVVLESAPSDGIYPQVFRTRVPDAFERLGGINFSRLGR